MKLFNLETDSGRHFIVIFEFKSVKTGRWPRSDKVLVNLVMSSVLLHSRLVLVSRVLAVMLNLTQSSYVCHRYSAFWIFVLACKFSFSYYFQVSFIVDIVSPDSFEEPGFLDLNVPSRWSSSNLLSSAKAVGPSCLGWDMSTLFFFGHCYV